MKTKTLYLASLFLIMITCTTCSTKKGNTFDTREEKGSAIPVDGRVPNEETAIRIAEAVLLPIHGERTYENRPFVAELKNDSIWNVEGSISRKALFGYYYVEIQKKDGKILRVGMRK